MRITVDRIEGELAVLELADDAGAPQFVSIPLRALPEHTAEGDVLTVTRQAGNTTDAAARLARLKARTPQGPGSFDL